MSEPTPPRKRRSLLRATPLAAPDRAPTPAGPPSLEPLAPAAPPGLADAVDAPEPVALNAEGRGKAVGDTLLPTEFDGLLPLAERETPNLPPRVPPGALTEEALPPAPVVARGWTAPPPAPRRAPRPPSPTTWLVAVLLGGSVVLALAFVLGAIGLGSLQGGALAPLPEAPPLGDAMGDAPEVQPAPAPAPAEPAPPVEPEDRTKVKLPKVRLGKKKDGE